MVVSRLQAGGLPRWIAAGIVVVVVVCVVWWWPKGEDETADSSGGVDVGSAAVEESESPSVEPAAEKRDRGRPISEARIRDGEQGEADVGESDGDDAVEAREESTSAPQPEWSDRKTGDAGETPDGVGPRRWMAEADEEETDELERRLDEGRMRQEFELARRDDRNQSVRVVRPLVEECYRKIVEVNPELDHRVALEWTMITEGGIGRIENPEVLYHRAPRDERFDECIVEALEGERFDAVGDGADLEVRWTNVE